MSALPPYVYLFLSGAWRLAGPWTPMIWSWWGNVNTICICQGEWWKISSLLCLPISALASVGGDLGRVSVPSPEMQCLQSQCSSSWLCQSEVWSLILPSWLEAEVWNKSTNYQIFEKYIWCELKLGYRVHIADRQSNVISWNTLNYRIRKNNPYGILFATWDFLKCRILQ